MSERNDGGNAFPWDTYSGMTLRDFFATTLPADSVQEITFRCLSLNAQEVLVGRKYPQEQADPSAERIAYQLEKMRFQIEVDAAIRFIHADSMLEARKS